MVQLFNMLWQTPVENPERATLISVLRWRAGEEVPDRCPELGPAFPGRGDH